MAEPYGQHLRQRFLIFTVSVKKDGEGEKKEEKRVLPGKNLRLEESSFNNWRDLSMFNC